MSKFFEVTVEAVVFTLKKCQRQKSKRNLFSRFPISYRMKESRVVKDFEDSGVQIDYKVNALKRVEY